MTTLVHLTLYDDALPLTNDMLITQLFPVCQSRRSLCEDALLKIRGVISFTFQMAVKRCVVRIRSDLKAEVGAGNPPGTQGLHHAPACV